MSENTPTWTERRTKLMAELRQKPIYVNCKHQIQLSDKTCQRSRDISRLIKEGDAVLKRTSAGGRKRNSYVVLTESVYTALGLD